VLVVDQNTKKDWKLHEGDSFQEGPFEASISAIGRRDVTIEFKGHLRRFRCGENLREGEDVDDSIDLDFP